MDASDYVYATFGVLTIVLGLFGNTMTFLCYKAIKKRSCRVHRFYIRLLTLCDTAVLLVGLLRKLVAVLTGHDVAVLDVLACKLLNSFGYYISHLSVWILVGASWERFTAITSPLKTQIRKLEKLYLVIVALVFGAIDGHHLFTDSIVYTYIPEAIVNGTSDLQSETVHATCSYDDGYAHMETVWPIIDVISYCVAPFLAIGVLNALIVYYMRRSNRFFRRHGDAQRELQSEDVAVRFATTIQQNADLSIVTQSNRQKMGLRASVTFSINNLEQREYRLTRLLLVFSCCFILCTSPNVMLIVISRFIFPRSESGNAENSEADLNYEDMLSRAHEAADLLMYFQHAVQFYLYCALSVTFRMHVINSFRRWAKSSRASLSRLRSSLNN